MRRGLYFSANAPGSRNAGKAHKPEFSGFGPGFSATGLNSWQISRHGIRRSGGSAPDGLVPKQGETQ